MLSSSGVINLLGRWTTLKDIMCYKGWNIRISLPYPTKINITIKIA
jgi:hypothetical protein